MSSHNKWRIAALSSNNKWTIDRREPKDPHAYSRSSYISQRTEYPRIRMRLPGAAIYVGLLFHVFLLGSYPLIPTELPYTAPCALPSRARKRFRTTQTSRSAFHLFLSFGPTTRRNHTGPGSLRTNIKQWCGNSSLLKDDTCHRREVLDPRARRLGTKAILGSRTRRPFVRVL